MPRVARCGDRGIKGVIEPLAASHENCSDGQTTAKVGGVSLCAKHSPSAGNPHRIKTAEIEEFGANPDSYRARGFGDGHNLEQDYLAEHGR